LDQKQVLHVKNTALKGRAERDREGGDLAYVRLLKGKMSSPMKRSFRTFDITCLKTINITSISTEPLLKKGLVASSFKCPFKDQKAL